MRVNNSTDGVADVLQIKTQLPQFYSGPDGRENTWNNDHIDVVSRAGNKEAECVLPSMISAHYLCFSVDLWVWLLKKMVS